MKYRNKPCEFLGEKYRSQKERDRHQELLMLKRSGLLAQLQREVAFVLAPAAQIQGRKRPPIRYFADFTYVRLPNLQLIVEDCKGVRTPVYNLKRHLMKSVHGVDILET